MIDVQQGGVSRTYVATLEAKVKERDSQIKDLEYRVRDLVRVEEDLLEISKEKNCLHDKLTVRDAALDFCRKGISRLETEIATHLEALRASHSDNKKQATNIQSLTSDLLSEQGRATVLQKKVTDQVSELETLKANAERLELERSSLQTSLKFAEQEVSALKATIQSSETEKLDLQELLNAANTELETCMAELDLRQTSLDDMTSQRDQLQRDLRDEKENLKRAEEYNEALVEVNTRNGDAIDKGNDNRAKLLARFHSMEKAVSWLSLCDFSATDVLLRFWSFKNRHFPSADDEILWGACRIATLDFEYNNTCILPLAHRMQETKQLDCMITARDIDLSPPSDWEPYVVTQRKITTENC